MAQPVEFEIRVDEGQALRDLQRLEKQLEDVGSATTRTAGAATKGAQATKALGDSSREAGRKLGMQVNEVSELLLGFGALNPKLRETTLSFATAGNSAVTLGASMGPVGVAIAGLSAALPLLIRLFMDSGEEAREAASGFDAMTASLDEAISKVRELDAARAQEQRRAMGVQTVDETRGDVLIAQGRVGSQQARLERALRSAGLDPSAAQNIAAMGDGSAARRRLTNTFAASGGSVDDLNGLLIQLDRVVDAREELTDAVHRQADAQRDLLEGQMEEFEVAQAIAAEEEAARSTRSRGGRRGGRSRGPSAGDQPLTLDNLETELEGNAADTIAGITTPEAVRAAALAEELDLRKEIASLQGQAALDEAMAAERQAAKVKLTQAELETEREMARTEAELAKTQSQAFDLVNQGSEAAFELFNAQEGEKELIRGAIQVAQAIGAYPDGFGIAQHGIAAALHFANAAKLGVGGGGGGAPIPSAGQTARATPPPGFGGGGDSGGGGTTVMNFNSPVPEALIGQYQRRADRAYKARYGS
jgi:hypothetical protein